MAESSQAPFDIGLLLLVIALLTVFFPLLWCGIVILISYLGDWHRLAKRFAASSREPTGTRHEGVLGWVGIASYKFTLIVHIAGDGFYIETSRWFRMGHPRLFVPWSAVSKRETRGILGREINFLTIGAPPVGKIGLALTLPG